MPYVRKKFINYLDAFKEETNNFDDEILEAFWEFLNQSCPEYLTDPVSLELMLDPYFVTVSGRTYEKDTLERLPIMDGTQKDPITGFVFLPKDLAEDFTQKAAIQHLINSKAKQFFNVYFVKMYPNVKRELEEKKVEVKRLLQELETTNSKLAKLQQQLQDVLQKNLEPEQINLSSSSSTSSSNVTFFHNESKPKLKPEGLVKIRKVICTDLISDEQIFDSIRLVFENENQAKAFKSKNILTENFRFLFPPNIYNELGIKLKKKCALARVAEDIKELGPYMLKELEELIDISKVPIVFTDYYGRELIEQELPEQHRSSYFGTSFKNG